MTKKAKKTPKTWLKLPVFFYSIQPKTYKNHNAQYKKNNDPHLKLLSRVSQQLSILFSTPSFSIGQ